MDAPGRGDYRSALLDSELQPILAYLPLAAVSEEGMTIEHKYGGGRGRSLVQVLVLSEVGPVPAAPPRS